MKTNVRTHMKSRQPGRSCGLMMFGALVAAVMLATPMRALATAVSDDLWASIEHHISAAIAADDGDATTVVAEISAAASLLNQAKADLAAAGLPIDPVKFGKNIDKTNLKLAQLMSSLSVPGWSTTSTVKKLAKSAKSLQKLAKLTGLPLLREVDARSAGFHKAGAVVDLQFAIPEGCTDWDIYYTETVDGVLSSATYSATTGAITVQLGSPRGSADIVVTGCGLPAGGVSKQIYNYGGKAQGGGGGPTITANPNTVSMTASVCYPAKCTVSQTITITSSTPWTSSDPGFGGLGAYGDFLVSPNSGPIGSTSVTISYTSYGYGSENGFIRFRTTTTGVYVEVPVTVNQ